MGAANPTLTVDVLRDSGLLVDNLFADLWKQVGMKTLLNRAGFSQRSGTPMAELMYCLVLWVWLKAGSVGLFARESLHLFAEAEKDAWYGVMNREDLDWRRLHQRVALRAIGAMKMSRGVRKPWCWMTPAKHAMARKCQGCPVTSIMPRADR